MRQDCDNNKHAGCHNPERDVEHLPSQAGGRGGEGGSGAADPDSVLTSRARREQKSFHISKVTDADRAGRFHRMRRRLRLQVALQELLEDPLELYRMKSGPNRSGHSHDWPFFTNRTGRSMRKPWRLVLTWFWVLEYSHDGPRKRRITCLGRPTPPPLNPNQEQTVVL